MFTKLQLYLAIGALAVIGLVAGYATIVTFQLQSARTKIVNLERQVESLQGDLSNAQTRNRVEDDTRRDPDPVGRLRDRWSRPE